MKFTRRDFLQAAGAATIAGSMPTVAFSQGTEIKLGSILDNSGNLDIYGKPMVLATKLAVDEINEAGGLLGRKIKLIQYDSQSDIALYTKYAQQLVREDKVDVVHGGITSASRTFAKPFCPSRVITSCTRISGAEAPAVSATVFTPSSHFSSMSRQVSIR